MLASKSMALSVLDSIRRALLDSSWGQGLGLKSITGYRDHPIITKNKQMSKNEQIHPTDKEKKTQYRYRGKRSFREFVDLILF